MKVIQLCLTLFDPIDGSPPGSSVHGIVQARILEWVAIPFSRGSSQPRSPEVRADSLPFEPPWKHIIKVSSMIFNHEYEEKKEKYEFIGRGR